MGVSRFRRNTHGPVVVDPVAVGPRSGQIVVNTPQGPQLVQQYDVQERRQYDTLELSAAAIPIGDNFLFTDLTGKDLRLANLSQSGQLPSDWEMSIDSIMIQVTPNSLWAALTVDNIIADFHNIFQAMYFEFEVGQTTMVTQGRLEDYPYPFGKNVYAMVSQDNIAAPTTIDVINVNNGSVHGTPRRFKTPIHITPDLTFRANIHVFEAITLLEPWHVRVLLDAEVKRPIR